MINISRIMNLLTKGKISPNTAIKLVKEIEKTDCDINEILFVKSIINLVKKDFRAAKYNAHAISEEYEDYNKVNSLLYTISFFENNNIEMKKYSKYAFQYDFSEEEIIKRQFYDKKISHTKAIFLLSNLKNKSKDKVNSTIAEIYYESGEYVSAKKIALKIDDSSNYANRKYLLLYKTLLQLEEIEEARKYFNMYKPSNENNKYLIDSMFSYLEGNLIIHEDVNYIVSGETNKELYERFAKAFYTKDFTSCEQIISQLDYSEEKYVDYKPLKCLYKKIKEKEIAAAYNNVFKAYEEKNIDELYKSLNIVASFGQIQKRSIAYKSLLVLLKDGSYDVENIFNKITLFDNEELQYRIIENGIKNNKKLDEEKKLYTEYTIIKGSYLKKKEDYEEAYDLYTSSYYKTENPLILYILGEMLYETKQYEIARDVLEEYIQIGYTHVNKAYYLLAKTYYQLYLVNRVHSDYKKYEKYTQITKSLNDIYNTLDYGYVKKHRNISMKEEDFEQKLSLTK